MMITTEQHTDVEQRPKNVIVLAPHVDDEVIGCYRFLRDNSVAVVVYFYEIDEVRREEAIRAAQVFRFTPIFLCDYLVEEWEANGTFANTVLEVAYEAFKERKDTVSSGVMENDVIIGIPNIADMHPDHKRVNNEFRRVRPSTFFYSVDMNVPLVVLSTPDLKEKHGLLMDLYPSQSVLWSTDSKYFLFESNLLTDLITSIQIKTTFEGVHCYPNAPEGVEFLRHPHRHVFHVSVDLQVKHDDRDVEFILFKREIDQLISMHPSDYQHRSCEMIARSLLEYVVSTYKGRNCTVSVSEDGENGATVQYRYQ